MGGLSGREDDVGLGRRGVVGGDGVDVGGGVCGDCVVDCDVGDFGYG